MVFAKVKTQPQAPQRPYKWRAENFMFCSQEDIRPGPKWSQPQGPNLKNT